MYDGGILLAQLIKLQDYISRYQVDLKRYPTQFIRLKQVQWERMKDEWHTQEEQSMAMETVEAEEKTKKPSFFKRLFHLRKTEIWSNPWERENEKMNFSNSKEASDEIPEETSTLNFNPTMLYRPDSEFELKRMYVDQLFHFQLKWASSTLREKSYIDPKYQRDVWLRQVVQKLPDTYFVLYNPILKLKKAPIEVGVVILTPTDCYVIQKVEAEDMAAFTGNSKDRFWLKKFGEHEKKILNPLTSLYRMEKVVEQIMEEANAKMKIHRVLLSQTGYIDYPGSIYDVSLIDRRNIEDWFNHLKGNASPMKHLQFKAAEALLTNSQTTSYNRSDWYKATNELEEKE